MKPFPKLLHPLALGLMLLVGQVAAQDVAAPAATPPTAPADSTPPAVAAPAPADPVPAPDAAAEPAPEEPAASDSPKDAQEKVIVVGYGTLKKKDVTGSVSVVDAKDLQKTNSTNAAAALQGKASGVTVTQSSGQPGKAPQVRVRGMGTINNSDPLYVVDGMPTTDITYLNPADIEAITVLKDASSTSIYGARGANGVILVTTKRGTTGKSKVSYAGSYGVSSPWKDPDLVNAAEWVTLHNRAVINGGDTSAASQLPAPANPAGTNWWKEVTRTDAVNYAHNFSLAQGDKSLNYFLSGGHSKDAGIIRGSDSRKSTVRANVNARVRPWLTLGNTIGFTNQLTHLADESDEWNSTLITAISMDPITPVRNPDGSFASSVASGIKNPAGIVARNDDKVETNRIKGNAYASVKPWNTLELKSNYGLDVQHDAESRFRPKYTISGADQQSTAEVRREDVRSLDWVWENTAAYDLAIGETQFVKLLVGATAEENNSENMLATNTETPTNDPTQRFLSSTLSLNPQVSGSAVSNALLSYLGRVNYDYDTKYILTAALRADGSSKFGPDNRWGYFPSAGAGWDITKEGFLESVGWLNYLKLRAGWGVIGNQNIDDYAYTTNTTGSQNYAFGKTVVNGQTFTSAGTPDVQWEEQTSTNIGLDFTILDNSIEFGSDFYVKKTSEMLLRASIPGQAGLRTPPLINGGDVENMGFDLSLAWRKEIGAYSMKVTGNYSMYTNEVTSLGEEGKTIDAVPFRSLGTVNRSEKGKPIASFYGLITDGLHQDTVGGNIAGSVKYRDANGDGDPDRGYIGSPHPDFTYGFAVDLGHKGGYGALDFHMFWQGVQGNEIYNGTRFYTDQNTGFFNLDRRMLGAWSETNKHNDVNRPVMNTDDAASTAISDRFVEDGSYLRLKTMTLGYTLPFKALETRVYAGASNLLTFTAYSGFDPEIGSGRYTGSQADNPENVGGLDIGIDRGNYPQPRTLFTGLEVSL